MKKIVSLSLVALLFTSCYYKENKILDINSTAPSRLIVLDLGTQDKSALPLNSKDEYFNGDELLKKRFEVFEYSIKDSDRADAFWAFNIYKPSEKKSYYGSNYKKLNDEWFLRHMQNADQNSFGRLSKLAITTANTSIRNFPTDEPLLYNPQRAGEGYPFDYLQASSVSIGYPLFVSHLSLDGAWALVKDDVVWGWIKTTDIKFINKDEASKFKNSKFISILKDKAAVYGTNGEFLFSARVGAILPFNTFKDDEYFGEIYTSSGVKRYKINSEFASSYPLKFNNENVITIANSMLNDPYGWGGLNGLRDCSLLTKDFFTSFGIWLPRNSSKQASIGTKISFDGLNNAQKIELIKQKAVPYMTLLHSAGHIMIYAGIKDDKVLIYHDAWGIKTKGNGRALIGQVALTAVDIGSDISEVDEKDLLISKIKSMNILKPDYDKKEIIKKAYGVGIDGDFVVFDSKKRVLFDDKIIKDSECSTGADIEDMVGYYSALKPINSPLSDVGRCRNYELLGEIYGKNESEIKANLKEIVWIKDFIGTKLLFNSKNNASKALQNVSDELNELVKIDIDMLKYLKNPAGTFKYRNIAGTNRLSPHSYGIAIDINLQNSHYWRWHNKYKNLIPEKIVHIFEKHGFIWGGRWVHFDTMHFEYRPELF